MAKTLSGLVRRRGPVLPQVFGENLDVVVLAQAAQGPLFDLADAFACQVEGVGHFLRRHLVPPDAEQHFQDEALAVGEHAQGGVEVGGERLQLHLVVRAGGRLVGHDVDEAVGVVVLERRVHADFLPVRAQRVLYLGDVRVEEVRQFLHGGTALELLLEIHDGLGQFALESHLVERHPHDAALFGDGLQDALPDPPYRVADELEASCLVEFLGGLDEAQVALVYEVVQGQSLVLVLFRHADHEAQVGSCQAFQGFGVAMMDALGKLHFFVCGYKFLTTYFYEIFVQCRAGTVGDTFVDFELSHVSARKWVCKSTTNLALSPHFLDTFIEYGARWTGCRVPRQMQN